MRRLDFTAHRPRYDASIHTEEDVLEACRACFQAVSSDLGTDDITSDAFYDYIGDTMSDAKVPDDMIERVRAKFREPVRWRRR